MGRKPSDKPQAFARAVVDVIETQRERVGLTQAKLLDMADMSANYYAKRKRYELPLDTNDVSRLAEALGISAFDVMRDAEESLTSEALALVTPILGNPESIYSDPEMTEEQELKYAADESPVEDEIFD